MSSIPDLRGRTALITGSAKRVGRAILLRIAAAGADVIVHYHTSESAAERTVESAVKQGVNATAIQADITDPDSVDSLFRQANETLGPVDILINNVGDFDPRHWEEIEWNAWKKVVETNFYGTVLCTRAALQSMREDGWGRVVNIGFADSDQLYSHPENFPYFVAKTGVLMFTRMVASETQDAGITVNAVSPFAVKNTASDVSSFPRGRAATFDDVTAPILFFLSDDAAYISGENVGVDGGRLAER
jgi:NAD(P)-dependent dehydrogenase (short-subunit alcohol dehydrogenase family)